MTTRVVHVTTGLGVGGAETMLFRLVGQLQHRAQSHAVIALTGESCFDFAAVGVPVFLLGARHGGNPLRMLSSLRHALSQCRPDVIHGWMYHGNVAASVAAPRGIPVVWGVHHALHDLANEKPLTRAVIKAGALLSRLPSTRRIVYVSQASRRHHEHAGYAARPGEVVPNGFDCESFAPSTAARSATRALLGYDDGDIVFGSFGRFHPVKAHDLLLNAFARVASTAAGARLLLAGTGMTEDNEHLQRQVRALGLTGKVRMVGPRDDMPALYNALDAYVLSSRSESFPNVLGEAGACGVPCVTTDVGDAAVIVGEGGQVVAPGDETALASAMSRLAAMSAHERTALGERARAGVQSRFSLEAAVERHRALYESLATEARPR